MFAQRNRLGVLAVALSASAGAMAQAAAPLPDAASAQQSTPRSATSPTNKPATTAQLNQPRAVVIAPPILRNEGKKVATPDRPIFGAAELPQPTVAGSGDRAPAGHTTSAD